MKSKFKMKDLASQQAEFELVHPVFGPTGSMLKMRGPHSGQFQNVLEAMTAEDRAEAFDKGSPSNLNIKLAKAIITEWDDEAWDMPCTPENIEKIMSDPDNKWFEQEVSRFLNDVTAYFPKLELTLEPLSEGTINPGDASN